MGGVTGITELHKPRSGRSPNVMDYLQGRKLDLVINDPETADHEVAPTPPAGSSGGSAEDGGPGGRDLSVTDGYLIRRTAIDFGVSLITNSKVASLLALSLERVKSFHIKAMEVRHRGRELCGSWWSARTIASHSLPLSPPSGSCAGVLYNDRDLGYRVGRFRAAAVICVRKRSKT